MVDAGQGALAKAKYTLRDICSMMVPLVRDVDIGVLCLIRDKDVQFELKLGLLHQFLEHWQIYNNNNQPTIG